MLVWEGKSAFFEATRQESVLIISASVAFLMAFLDFPFDVPHPTWNEHNVAL